MANFVTCNGIHGDVVYVNMDNVIRFRQLPESDKPSSCKGKDVVEIDAGIASYIVLGTAQNLYLDACVKNNAVCT